MQADWFHLDSAKMSVVIEEIDEPEYTENIGTGPDAATEGQNINSERFHDAGEASSDDEWQDVTEHFDGATLSQGPHDQGDHCSDGGSGSDGSFDVAGARASASLDTAPQHAGPSTTLPLQGAPAAQDAAAAAPEQHDEVADQADAPPPPLLRPPDDFWDRTEPGRFPRGGFNFGDKWNAEGQVAAGPAAEKGTPAGVDGEQTTDAGEEQPQEPEQMLTEEDIKVRAGLPRMRLPNELIDSSPVQCKTLLICVTSISDRTFSHEECYDAGLLSSDEHSNGLVRQVFAWRTRSTR